jgi:hypothetical protein
MVLARLHAPRRAGAWAAWALILGACLASFARAGTVVNFGYPLIACGIALVLLHRARHLDYLEFVLWLWLVDPGVRRIADYGSHYHATSPVIVTAELVSFVSVYASFGRSGRVFREVRATVVVVFLVVSFGFVSGLIHGQPFGSLTDLLFYGGPLALGVWLLTAPVGRHAVLQRLQEIAIPALLVLGIYGVVQFLNPPAWDVAWVENSGITDIGSTAPFQIRVFSLLDTAGPFGQTMTMLLLLAMQPIANRPTPNQWLRRIAIGVGLVGLGLSLARQAWIALAVGVIVLMWNRRLALTRLVMGLVAVGVVVGLFGGPIGNAITGRFNNTVQAGSSDTSLLARTRFQAQIAPQALRNIAGEGLGSTGVATKLAGSTASSNSTLISSFDSGIFEIIYTFGSLAGLAFLAMVVRVTWRVGRRHLRRGPPEPAFAAAAMLGLTIGLLFTNTMKGVYGADFWILVGAIGTPLAGALHAGRETGRVTTRATTASTR